MNLTNARYVFNSLSNIFNAYRLNPLSWHILVIIRLYFIVDFGEAHSITVSDVTAKSSH